MPGVFGPRRGRRRVGGPDGVGYLPLCRQAQLAAPVVAIGGIGPTNAGADGLAVISAVAGAPDVRAACRALVDARG